MEKINKSELMTSAWVIARKNMVNQNARLNVKKSVRFFFQCALESAWAELKETQAQNKKESFSTVVKSSKSSRYVTLLSIAEKKNLNHGNSWYASGKDIDKNQLHPSWEGEEICYVYAA